MKEVGLSHVRPLPDLSYYSEIGVSMDALSVLTLLELINTLTFSDPDLPKAPPLPKSCDKNPKGLRAGHGKLGPCVDGVWILVAPKQLSESLLRRAWQEGVGGCLCNWYPDE